MKEKENFTSFTKEEKEFLIGIATNSSDTSELNSNYIKNNLNKILEELYIVNVKNPSELSTKEKTDIINNDIKSKLSNRENDIDYLIIFKAIKCSLECELDFYKDHLIKEKGYIDIIGYKILCVCNKGDSIYKDFSPESKLEQITASLKDVVANLIDILYPYCVFAVKHGNDQKEYHKELFLMAFDDFIINLHSHILNNKWNQIHNNDFLRNRFNIILNNVIFKSMSEQEARDNPQKKSF